MSNKVECQDEDYPNSQIGKDKMHALDMIFSKPSLSEIKLQLLDYMFTPNKPSRLSPLSKGTRLYLIGLTKLVFFPWKNRKKTKILSLLAFFTSEKGNKTMNR